MIWAEAKAVAAEVLKNLRSRFSEPEIRLVLRAISRLHHKEKEKASSIQLDPKAENHEINFDGERS